MSVTITCETKIELELVRASRWNPSEIAWNTAFPKLCNLNTSFRNLSCITLITANGRCIRPACILVFGTLEPGKGEKCAPDFITNGNRHLNNTLPQFIQITEQEITVWNTPVALSNEHLHNLKPHANTTTAFLTTRNNCNLNSFNKKKFKFAE